MVLIFIEGGPEPFAGHAYDSAVLMDNELFNSQRENYRWTSRVLHSPNDPAKVAQVWQHVSLAGADAPPVGTSPIPSAAENTHSTASEEATREAALPVVNTFQAGQLVQEAVASTALDGETQAIGLAEPDHTGETPDVLDGNPDLPDGEQLFIRRKRLKLTVQQVADQAGLARSKVDSIEKGTGKRIKAAEVLAVVQVLEKAEGSDADSPRN